jgi:NTP pyrophosphatase (non-canonical NTP hydrolase)
VGDLSFQKFAATAKTRAERWFPIKQWSGSDWATALAGEVGEVCDVIKKLNRADIGRPGKNDPPRAELEVELGRELADVLTYAQLTAHRYGIDLAEALVEKFNAVSEREGFPERLELEPELETTLRAVPTLEATKKVELEAVKSKRLKSVPTKKAVAVKTLRKK